MCRSAQRTYGHQFGSNHSGTCRSLVTDKSAYRKRFAQMLTNSLIVGGWRKAKDPSSFKAKNPKSSPTRLATNPWSGEPFSIRGLLARQAVTAKQIEGASGLQSDPFWAQNLLAIRLLLVLRIALLWNMKSIPLLLDSLANALNL